MLKYDEWHNQKTGHEDDHWVVDLVRFGFPLQYHGTATIFSDLETQNHASGRNYAKQVDRFIKTEIQNGTILGPFTTKPFERANIAPIMTRPKSDPSKRRRWSGNRYN